MAFFARALSRYAAVNRATLDWMLARPALAHGFLNTKHNSVTLTDYGPGDGLAGPDYLYGWIQTRGLEALIHHAAAAGAAVPATWLAAIARLQIAVPRLRDDDGGAYFCYDTTSLRPLRLAPEGPCPQEREAGIATPSDIYMAAAMAMVDIGRDGHARAEGRGLLTISQAIAEKRFLVDETLPITAQSLARQSEPGFSPAMTLLGAALAFARRGRAADVDFVMALIEQVLSAHLDVATGLLRSHPEANICAGGLSLEFAGFALSFCAHSGERGPVAELARLAVATFEHCHTGLAIPTWTGIDDRSHHSGLFAWWPLAEAIRALAVGYDLTGNPACLSLWQEADRAFFAKYWRPDASLAYQMRDTNGPLQRAPATPDLDPGYHTGLSLLDASGAIMRLS